MHSSSATRAGSRRLPRRSNATAPSWPKWLQWRVFGFGHCPLQRSQRALQTFSLRSCLWECDRRGLARCRFASYVSTDVLRRTGRARGGACHLARHCQVLLATTLGAITYEHHRGRHDEPAKVKGQLPFGATTYEHGAGRVVEVSKSRGQLPLKAELVTLSLATPFAARPSWRSQLCASRENDVTLESSCHPTSRGFFQISRVASGSLRLPGSIRLAAANGERRWLCADTGRLELAKNCQYNEWQVFTSVAMCPTMRAEPSIWLRLRGPGGPFLGVLGSKAIKDTKPVPGRMLEFIGGCSAQSCGGAHRYIKWTVGLGTHDVEISSTFQATQLGGTALAFVLWSGTTTYHLGLDGWGNTFFYEGGSWGTATLSGASTVVPGKFQTLTVKRINGVVSVLVDGASTGLTKIPFDAPVTAIGWRPWRNSINVESLSISQVGLVPWTALNMSRSCGRWALGFLQPHRKEILDQSKSRDCHLEMCGSPCSSGHPQVDVWLLTSGNYHMLLYYMLYMLKHVGDVVRVHVRWVNDMRDAARRGWDKDWYFGFNTRKFMLVAEAMLHSELASCGSNEPGMIVIMDLDIVVFPGWTHTLASCIAGGATAADMCFIEQPEHPLEVANGGLYVWRGRSTAAAALVHASLARIQNLEVFHRILPSGPMELDQYIFNNILLAAQQAATTQPDARPLRWGLYNPMLARVGPAPSAPLTLRLQHVTFGASLEAKMIYMKRVHMVVTGLRDMCGWIDAACSYDSSIDACGFRSRPNRPGPLSPLCMASLEGDPHFGPKTECFKVYGSFKTTHKVSFTQRLRRAMTEVAGLHSHLWVTPEGGELMQLLSDNTRDSLDWDLLSKDEVRDAERAGIKSKDVET